MGLEIFMPVIYKTLSPVSSKDVGHVKFNKGEFWFLVLGSFILLAPLGALVSLFLPAPLEVLLYN